MHEKKPAFVEKNNVTTSFYSEKKTHSLIVLLFLNFVDFDAREIGCIQGVDIAL